MKSNQKNILNFTFFFLFSVFFFQFSYAKNKKLALIVGISKYQRQWGKLNTEIDIKLIKETLIKKGFKEENIVIIRDEQATKENIIRNFEEHLINQAEKGDILVFHFSGHGQQVIDMNNDEADGYDEALVPYDANAYYTRKYKGENHLIDDELNVMIYNARKKIGTKGSLMFIIDACYSGTISRGNNMISRGAKGKLAPRGYKPKLNIKIAQTSGVYEIKKEDEKNLGNLIVFSGARQDETNYETYDNDNNPVGSLSLAFSRSMSKINKNTSYSKLFDKIKIEMVNLSPQQTPQIEGNLDYLIFGGKAKETEDYFMIKEKINDSIYVINAGGLNGIFEGTTFSVYDIIKKKKERKKATGYVIKATEFDSKVLIKYNFKETELNKNIIYINNKSFGALKINVFLDLKRKNKIGRFFKKHQLIKIVKEENIYNADVIIKDSLNKSGETFLQFNVKNNEEVFTLKVKNKKVKTIAKAIEQEMKYFSRAKYLRSINLVNPDLDVQVEVLPVDYELVNRRPVVTKIYTEKSKLAKNGQLIFNKDDVVILQIINKGSSIAYFQIIDIQSDNSISMLIPDENTPASDIKILPNDTIIFKTQLMQINEPLGNDMLKVIASKEPIDNLRKIISNTKARQEIKSTRSKISPFEELILKTMDGVGTRGLTPFSVPINEINIYSKILNIRP